MTGKVIEQQSIKVPSLGTSLGAVFLPIRFATYDFHWGQPLVIPAVWLNLTIDEAFSVTSCGPVEG